VANAAILGCTLLEQSINSIRSARCSIDSFTLTAALLPPIKTYFETETIGTTNNGKLLNIKGQTIAVVKKLENKVK